MAESEQMLTEEQIGAVGEGESVQKSAPATIPEETPVRVNSTTMEELRSKPVEPPPESAAPASGVMQASVAQLIARVDQLEQALQQANKMQQELQALLEQLQSVNKQVDSITSSIQGTVGFEARQTFICQSCHSKGQVAARLNCTACGEENWWGWWPPQERE